MDTNRPILDGRAPPAERVIRPAAAPGPLDNPLKGWCPYTDAGPLAQPYSMVFLYASWRELEPHEGDYRFAEWEKRVWEAPSARGKHVVIRVYVDYPTRPSGIPEWLLAKGVRATRYTDYGGGLSPDYDDPHLITAMERLIAALGRRYDPDPRVAFFQMGLLGFWGEWHTYPRDDLFARPATQQRMLEAARRSFPHKIVMTRYPGAYAGQQPWLGFFDDMFPEDTDGPEEWKFLPALRRAGRTNNWKQSAIGGEMVPGAASRWLGPDFERTLRMVEATHFSWVGPYCPALEAKGSAEFHARSEALVRRMGYEFRLTEVRHADQLRQGGTLAITITGENTGVAPFYYSWPVELALLDEKRGIVETLPVPTDIRTWLPGPFHLSAAPIVHTKPGRYTIALGIRDPWTRRPAIGFANALPRHEGWTLLSDVVIHPS